MVARVTGPTPAGGVLDDNFPDPSFSAIGEAQIDTRAGVLVDVEAGVRAAVDEIHAVDLMRRQRVIDVSANEYGGILGNNTGNDGPSIQNALGDWAANGGKLTGPRDAVMRTTQGLVMPSGTTERVYIIDGNGFEIRGVGAFDILSDTVPADTAVATNRCNRKFVIEDFKIGGDAVSAQRGLVLRGTSRAELGGVHVQYCSTNFDLVFALNGKLTDCFAKGGDYDYKIRSGTGEWADANGPGSAANITSLDNCRSFAKTGAIAQFYIFQSGEVVLKSVTTEGFNSVDAIVFDRDGNTTTIQFNIDNWHPENSPTNSHLKLLGGPAFVRLQAVDWTQGLIMIDVADFAAGEIVLLDCPKFVGKFRHAHPGGPTGGVAWSFVRSGGTSTDVMDPALWDNAIVPTYHRVDRWSTSGELGGTYPVIQGGALALKTNSLQHLFDRTVDAPSGKLGALVHFALNSPPHPDVLAPGDYDIYRDESAKDLRIQLKRSTDAATGVLAQFLAVPYGGPLGYNLFTRRTTAPADADLANGEMAIYWDATSGAPKLKIKGKDSAGTLFTHTLSGTLSDLLVQSTQSGTAYTLLQSDNNTSVDMTNASANVVTVPQLTTGTVIEVAQIGAGQTSFTAGAGVTFVRSSKLKLAEQGAAASLRWRSATSVLLSGELIA